MTPKQRAQVALAGGKPDRVPFVPEVDYDYIAKAAGREPWEFNYADGDERARMLEAFFLRHACDIWPCWSSPSRRRMATREIIREGDAAYYLDKRTGRRYRIARRGELLDEQGEVVVLGAEGETIDEQSAAIWVAGGPYPRPVEAEADIEELLGPVRPPQDWIDDGFFASLQALQPRYDETHLLAFCLNTLFAEALDLFGGFQEGLVALYTQPGLMHKAMEAVVARRKTRIQAGASVGAKCTWMIEYCAGADTISGSMYREFVFPYEQEIAREQHRHGIQTYLWFLGDPMPLLPDLARLEVDGLYVEQGRKGYEVDVVEMRRHVGERMCLIGFNYEADLLAGNRQALEREMERQIRGAGANGAFMMGTTYVAEDTPLEHLDWYVETLHRLGEYE